MIYTALPHNGVGDVTGFNLPIHGKVLLCDRTVPNIMIAFAVPNESTFMLL
jgi:hypothetical protein